MLIPKRFGLVLVKGFVYMSTYTLESNSYS